MAVAIPIILILVVAVATIVGPRGTARGGTTGALSRETSARRDQGAVEDLPTSSPSTELETAGRERCRRNARHARRCPRAPAARRRRSSGSRSTRKSSASPAGSSSTAACCALVGFSRRRLRRRVPRLPVADHVGRASAPRSTSGRTSDIDDYIEAESKPFYVPEARAYVVQYPKRRTCPGRRQVYDPITYRRGWKRGIVALYQQCVHLGCRVPFCDASQWFECPCHGSKYNRVGEKTAGPAPRGLDRFAIEVSRRPSHDQHRQHPDRPADRHRHDRSATGRAVLRRDPSLSARLTPTAAGSAR